MNAQNRSLTPIDYREQAEETLRNGNIGYQGEWTQSIAVGGKTFIEEIKEKLGLLAKGRKALERGGTFQLREPAVSYNVVSDAKMEDIGPQNTCYWKIS